nr:zinc finger, CCHC-type [Tanacetum cinerariifolium]
MVIRRFLHLKNSFANLMEEENVHDECTKEDKFKAGKEASTSKSKFTTLDCDDDCDDDDDEVCMPDTMLGGLFCLGFKYNDNKRVFGFGLEQQEGAVGLTVKGSLKIVFEFGFRNREYFRGAKFDIKKFNETGDFALWRIKMRALLIQHGCEAALEVLPAYMEAQTKAELNKKAHKSSKAKGDDGEGLYVMGRTGRKDSRDDGDERTCSARLDHGFRMFIPHDTQLVENQTGRTVKKLRTDNDLKFCNWEFEQLCIESGVARHLAVVGMPQQNRLAECMNITLMDKTDQEDGDDEDARDQETDQTSNLTDYQLARDREPKTRTKPLRFRDESNMAAYAFVAAEEEDIHEPLTYQEAVACEDSSKWKVAMKEEMDSLRKNKT